MKKFLSVLALLSVLLLSLAACTQPVDDGTVTVVIGTEEPTEYSLEYKAEDITNGLFSVLDKLEIEYTLDSYSMLASVGELAPTPPNYIYIYTSVEADFDVSSYALETEYKGTRLVSSGVGAKDMHVEDGAIIYIGTITW